MEHRGETAVQRMAGVPRAGAWGSARVRPEIPDAAADFLRHQRMLVIGATDTRGRMWAGALTGPEGFAQSLDERRVMIGALPGPGDPLEGAFESERELGVIAIEPATRRRMRVNGTAHAAGAGLLVHTDQVYSNCPKYIQARTIVPGPGHVSPVARSTDVLDARQREWISRADTFFVATHAEGLGADVSHRGGNPGFVTVSGERHLAWPDYVGNMMFMTLGNLELDPACGLLFLDYNSGDALHLTGRARVKWGSERSVGFEVDGVVEITGASPLRWEFGDYSKHNPA
ncbi:pyridoxamine 5'-phosphate oxidase family protein [Nonomuraea sp. NPDC059194]|uniref:pyridoxamine 5'-phosphate oxidase family protein n=1 Tax=Nonomuraea sp. NPDC059194 TaxID=3346764 RepID=UPI0036A84DF5